MVSYQLGLEGRTAPTQIILFPEELESSLDVKEMESEICVWLSENLTL